MDPDSSPYINPEESSSGHVLFNSFIPLALNPIHSLLASGKLSRTRRGSRKQKPHVWVWGLGLGRQLGVSENQGPFLGSLRLYWDSPLLNTPIWEEADSSWRPA